MTSLSFFFTVSSMQRMIAQIGTPQDNQQLQNQLYEFRIFISIRTLVIGVGQN